MTVSTESGASAEAEAPVPPNRPRFPTAWVAAALVVGLLLGLGAGLLAPRLGQPGDDSVEAGFLRDMASHHAQAVEMGMIAFENASDPAVRTMGRDIALTQHGQIGMMQAWLREWGLNPTGSQPRMAWMPDTEGAVQNGLMPGIATGEEMAALRAASGTDVDVQFLQLMRQHHLGGIHMAQAALDLTDDEDVTWIARTMVEGQQKEITAIQDLLARLQS